MLEALIWDVDGTVAETERDGHRVAFNQAFADAGLDWYWDEALYGRLLRTTGGRERLLAWMRERSDAPADAASCERLARTLHAAKGGCYERLVAQGRLRARPGVVRLARACMEAGIRMAVATTTGRGNVEALFARVFGADWEQMFPVRCCAEDAPRKKPDPQVYQLALARLRVGARVALAIEDSPAGLQAARAAKIACLVTPGNYFRGADFEGAAAVCADLDHADPAVPGEKAPASERRVELSTLRELVGAACSVDVNRP